MIVYYCPRCGRGWGRMFPRSRMKCRFCGQVWHPKHRGHKKRVVFSWFETFVWIAVVALIAYGVNLFQSGRLNNAKELLKSANVSHAAAPVAPAKDASSSEMQAEGDSQEMLAATTEDDAGEDSSAAAVKDDAGEDSFAPATEDEAGEDFSAFVEESE